MRSEKKRNLAGQEFVKKSSKCAESMRRPMKRWVGDTTEIPHHLDLHLHQMDLPKVHFYCCPLSLSVCPPLLSAGFPLALLLWLLMLLLLFAPVIIEFKEHTSFLRGALIIEKSTPIL